MLSFLPSIGPRVHSRCGTYSEAIKRLLPTQQVSCLAYSTYHVIHLLLHTMQNLSRTQPNNLHHIHIHATTIIVKQTISYNKHGPIITTTNNKRVCATWDKKCVLTVADENARLAATVNNMFRSLILQRKHRFTRLTLCIRGDTGKVTSGTGGIPSRSGINKTHAKQVVKKWSRVYTRGAVWWRSAFP